MGGLILLLLFLLVWQGCHLIYLTFIEPLLEAKRYADQHHLFCTPPPLLWIDEKENKWCTREMTDEEKWWLCFDSHLKDRR